MSVASGSQLLKSWANRFLKFNACRIHLEYKVMFGNLFKRLAPGRAAGDRDSLFLKGGSVYCLFRIVLSRINGEVRVVALNWVL